MKRILVLILLIFVILISGCTNNIPVTREKPKLNKSKLYISIGFGKFPQKYTCDGEDVSFPVNISGVSSEAKSVAVVVDDPDAPFGTFTHWIIWNIPPNVSHIPENISKTKTVPALSAVQGKNDFGKIGYNGPCPPGETHTYRIKVYVLDTLLNLSPGSDIKQFEKAIEGHVIQYGEVRASYTR